MVAVFTAPADISDDSSFPVFNQLDKRCADGAVDEDGFLDLGVLRGQGIGEEECGPDSSGAYGERDGELGGSELINQGAISAHSELRAAEASPIIPSSQEGDGVGVGGDGFVDLGMLYLTSSGSERRACPTTVSREEGERGGASCGRRGSEAMKTEVRGRLQALLDKFNHSSLVPASPQEGPAADSQVEVGSLASQADPLPSGGGPVTSQACAAGDDAPSSALRPESSTSIANGDEHTSASPSNGACLSSSSSGSLYGEDLVALPPGMDGLVGNPDGDALCPESFEASADKAVEAILAQQEGGPTGNARLNDELVSALREHLKMYRSPAVPSASNTQ